MEALRRIHNTFHNALRPGAMLSATSLSVSPTSTSFIQSGDRPLPRQDVIRSNAMRRPQNLVILHGLPVWTGYGWIRNEPVHNSAGGHIPIAGFRLLYNILWAPSVFVAVLLLAICARTVATRVLPYLNHSLSRDSELGRHTRGGQPHRFRGANGFGLPNNLGGRLNRRLADVLSLKRLYDVPSIFHRNVVIRARNYHHLWTSHYLWPLICCGVLPVFSLRVFKMSVVALALERTDHFLGNTIGAFIVVNGARYLRLRRRFEYYGYKRLVARMIISQIGALDSASQPRQSGYIHMNDSGFEDEEPCNDHPKDGAVQDDGGWIVA